MAEKRYHITLKELCGQWTTLIGMFMYICSVALLCPTLWSCGLRSTRIIHGIFQARILEWVVIFHSRESSQPTGWTHGSWVSCIGRWLLLSLYHLESPQNVYEFTWDAHWEWWWEGEGFLGRWVFVSVCRCKSLKNMGYSGWEIVKNMK